MKKSPAYGLKCCELLANYDAQSSSWKTLQMCLDWVEPESLEILPKSGMTVNGKLYRLHSSELHTYEKDGSVSLPTPTARTYKNNPCTPGAWKQHTDLNVEAAKLAGKTRASIGKKDRLSPHFVAWMMGYPIEWLD